MAYTHETTSRSLFSFPFSWIGMEIIFLSSLFFLLLLFIIGERKGERKCKRCRDVVGRLDPFFILSLSNPG